MPSEQQLGTSPKIFADALCRDGYVLLGEILSPDLVADLTEEFDRRYTNSKKLKDECDRSLETGDGRYMLTVELSGAFRDVHIYANPLILDVLNIVFGGKFVLDSLGIVLSLPGAKTQHTHRDGKGLFNQALDSLLPPYAVTVAVPLVDMNVVQGTTEIFPGSHRWKEGSPSVVPDVPAGYGLMWDYRTLHSGTENRSNRARPLLYMTYAKPWWRDLDNFEPASPASQKKILLGKGFLQSLSGGHRFLFRGVDASLGM